MNSALLVFGFATLCLPGLMPAAEVDVDETLDGEGEQSRRCFRFSAQTGPAEVLVVRSTRWENGAKVLEIEEVRCQPGGKTVCTLTLTERAPNYWLLSETAAEQHVQGVTLGRPERTAGGVIIELRPAAGAGAARRIYRFQWEARVEPSAALRKRQPDLPPTDTEWVRRQVVYPVPPSPGS